MVGLNAGLKSGLSIESKAAGMITLFTLFQLQSAAESRHRNVNPALHSERASALLLSLPARSVRPECTLPDVSRDSATRFRNVPFSSFLSRSARCPFFPLYIISIPRDANNRSDNVRAILQLTREEIFVSVLSSV